MVEQNVDKKTLLIIDLINQSQNYYTTSSCSGRLILISKPEFHNKHSVLFLFKTHQVEKIKNVKDKIKNHFNGQLWFILEPPVFHIGAKTHEDAIKLHQVALEDGLGLSMIKTITRNIIVEIRGTGRMDIPIGFGGELGVDNQYLQNIIDLSCVIMTENNRRVKNWENSLKLKFKI